MVTEGRTRGRRSGFRIHDADPSVMPWSLRTTGPLVRAAILWDTAWGRAVPASLPSGTGVHDPTVRELFRARLTPVLLDMVERRSTGVPDSGMSAAVRIHSVGLVAHALGVEATAVLPLRELAELGIDVMIMKGPAVAPFHPTPTTRVWQDIDLLMRPHQYGAAMAVLRRLGYRRSAATLQPWPWFDRVCLEGVNLEAGPRHALDVHHHVSPWALTGNLQADVLFERSAEARVGGVPVRVPSAPDSLVIAALHVVNDLWKGDASLMTWRDIAVLTSQLGRGGSLAGFERACLPWFGDIIWATMSALSGDEAGLEPAIAGWRHKLDWERIRVLGWDGDTFAARHPIGWAARLPVARGAAFLAGHAVPSPAYARGKHGGYLRYWQSAASSVFAAARGTDFRTEPLVELTGSPDPESNDLARSSARAARP